ncbi:MAG: isoleucine--tRNA ligase [Acidobacteriota bacterium]
MSDSARPDANARKKRYKKTLNLPKTSFPMRANLAQNEPQTRKAWDRIRLYDRLLEKRAEATPFVFHDGPPFANGSIHVGHLLNKVLKDFVVRTRNMAGKRCHFVPGWDCHGLPIEHKVMNELVASGKMAKLDALEPNIRRMAIRRACQNYAEKFKKLQAEQMQRLLTFGTYDDPYLTMRPGYEAAVLEVFASLVEQGLVYRALKPVHWSIANRTALAEAELEYRDRQDPSIYVGFEVADPNALAAAFGVATADLGRAPALMIWTTTPWTLPANRLIAVREDFDYALVRLAGGDRSGRDVHVVAVELLAKVAELAGVETEVLATARGEALDGLEYLHPFVADDHDDHGRGRVVFADYVTLEDGTGLVHTAPGHGQDDFETGQREGIAPYSPVLDDGTYDTSVPDWLHGLSVWDANPRIIEHLRASGHLVHAFEFVHSYPHDWRSKTPVIFRGTEQWFIAVDRPMRRDGTSLREQATRAAEETVQFVPGWGRKRLLGMIEARPDWCISRQRAWGLPIPAFRRPDGGVLLTTASVRAVAAAFENHGSDAWFEKEPADLLATYDPTADPDAPDDLDVTSLLKMYDIFDVWLESGSSWNAVMRRRNIGYPIDLYLEGSDQHRGWFQLSLLPALGATGEPPYRTLLTHGFIVDKNGEKMSKSLGNTLEVEDLLADHGADVLRWWVSSLAFDKDIKVDRSFFELAGESYRKVRNTLRFLLANLSDSPAEAGDPMAPTSTSLDAWILWRAAELRARVLEAYETYQYRQAHLLLFDFCNDELSAVYLDAVKDRLYCDPPDSTRRRAAQHTLRRLAELLAHLLAPFLPHTAEEAWRALHGPDVDSIHLGTFPEVEAPAIDVEGWAAVMATGEAIDKALEAAKERGLENPLDVGVEVADTDGVLARYADELVDLYGVSRVRLLSEEAAPTVVDLRDQPRCERSWRRDPTVRERSDGGFLSDRDAAAVGLADD